MWSWMWNFVPDSIFAWVTNLMLVTGVVLYIVSKLPVWIAQIKMYRLPVELAAVLLIAGGAYFLGRIDVEHRWKARVAELEQKVLKAEQQSQQVNTVIEERVVVKTKVIKQNVYINREIIREVAGAQLDATCTLPRSSVVLHDSASRNQVAERAAATDGTPSGVEAHRLLDTVVENYGACHENAAKLKAWQDWYREQKSIFEAAQR